MIHFIKMIINTITIFRRKTYWKKTYRTRVSHTNLSESEKKTVTRYFSPFFRTTLLFHEFYSEKTGKFCENYIPDDIYYCYIDPFFNDWTAAKILDNKCYYRWFLSDVKQPKCLAMRLNNIWYSDIDGELVFSSFDDILHIITNENCFVKQATNSEGGHGVYYLEKNKSKPEAIEIIKRINTDIIIQKEIHQSKTMSLLNPSSVNTVRVISLLDSRGVTIYSTIVRMGIKGSKVDNASSGGITCGVNTDGRLKSVAFAADGTKYFFHPDTGVKFNEIQIPNYDRILETVKTVHPRFSHFRLLSWDFALNYNDELSLIEVNLCYGELDFHQLNNGPVFGKDTQMILQEVFINKKDNRGR